MHFKVFSKWYRMEDIFWVAKIQIFIWVLEIPDILLG